MRIYLMTAAICGLCSYSALAQQQDANQQQAPAEKAGQEAQQSQPQTDSRQDTAAEQDTASERDTAAHDQADHENQGSENASADTNYRFHNNRWWYWQNDQWLMWSGNRWLTPDQRNAQRSYSYQPGRSFSYMQQPAAGGPYVYENGDAFVPTEARLPDSSASGLRGGFYTPGTVEYQKVLPSYGIRSAGSKILGDY